MPEGAGPWPGGKRFAFTIVDDTEASTVQNAAPVYALLREHGILVTKTVWPLGFVQTPLFGGGTLEDPDYRAWVLDLAGQGFEIASHGATDHSAPREMTERGLEFFRDVIGDYPRLHVNHFGQAEGIYWGRDRLNGGSRLAYQVVNGLLRRETRYYGHVEGSPYFWGDLCRDCITYVRNLAFPDVNTLRADPLMPYHDPRRPYVRYWFSSTEAPTCDALCNLLSQRNLERLEEEGGACIAYTHFAFGFMDNGRLNPDFVRAIERLAGLQAWFAPVSSVLDHLRARPGWQETPGDGAVGEIQRRWLFSKLMRGRL